MNRQALNLKEEAAKLELQLESSCNDLKMSEGELVPWTAINFSCCRSYFYRYMQAKKKNYYLCYYF